MLKSSIKKLLDQIGFECQSDDVYRKSYPHPNCEISVDFVNKTIKYPEAMKVGDRTTSNFSHDENFVVLECVNRLFDKGYSPSSIELEKSWVLGKVSKGKLDILVKHQTTEAPYIMIECKTFGHEFETEVNRMLTKQGEGGQLFSYWHQDREADYLCLYASRIAEDGRVEFKNNIVKIDQGIRNSSSTKTAYERWNKQFVHTGIFDDDVQPYNVIIKPLVRHNLKQLQKKDGNLIYLQFLEILRHNVVSDKGNAFNKIFNLFLCKIVDEDRNPDKKLDFQWIEGRDDSESLIGRLNHLFKTGMDQYLNKVVTDYNPDDLNFAKEDPEIARIITELRLYKNQEFAFVEVYNKESFEENSKIVIEMVKLLQGWQIRYTHKQQFLGDFFELLLNTGFKQESGQFFTPVPLVRFIIQSLPVAEIIHEKIDNGETNFLPMVIDFACGSGHFLTESMDVIHGIIESRLDRENMTPAQRDRHKAYEADQFGWASDFIFGIEKDYRLAKTSKLSAFLNGDGEASVMHGSGIDPLWSDSYVGKLQAKMDDKENPIFDILVANPPYAVKGFKETVKSGGKQFHLFNMLTEKSDEIEVLFVERMAQLVKPGGVAGIVLPRSFLNIGGPYEDARQMLLENFLIKGIVILGSKAFLSTGINTVILMLKKRQSVVKLTNNEVQDMCAGEIILVNTARGGNDAEKRFLGFEFSTRKGSEGIKIRNEFFLYNDKDLMSCDHVNSYIYKAMLGKSVPKPSERLKDNVRVLSLGDVLDTDANSDTPFAINVDLYKLHHDQIELVPLADHIDKPEAGKRPRGGYRRLWMVS